MAEWTMEVIPLPALFEQARDVEEGMRRFATVRGDDKQLGLFSANETGEDISTTNLKYLLVPYYLAGLIEQVAQGDRIQVLKVSQGKLKEFISFCKAMELVPEELETFAQEIPHSLADWRDKKIARLRRQRAAESKLQEIKEQERRGQSSRAAALPTTIKAGEENVLDDDG